MSKLAVVTGGAGFIGSHLCERLVKDGYSVISLDNYFTGSRENHVRGVEYREGHTKDIAKHISETPDIVFHLGEYARTEKSFEDIETVWNLNKEGTFAVLEFCRKNNTKIVYAGSSTKFGDEGLGRDQSPYAWTKATNTELVRNYGEWFNLPYAITYFYNVYGPREISKGPYATVVGIFKEEYVHKQPITVVSPGTQTRNFTHVEDIVNGLVLVGENGHGDGYGIGNEKEYSILELAQLFEEDVVMLPERAGNRKSSPVTAEKTKALGWTAHISLEDEIARFKKEAQRDTREISKRVLVFTTTFFPNNGPAEEALCELMGTMPDVTFDIVTAKYSTGEKECPVKNARVHHVGMGSPLDKYLLPFLSGGVAKKLAKEHEYLFAWSLMASYGTFGAFSVRNTRLPVLVTLADQKISWYLRLFLHFVMRRADQVYATYTEQEKYLPEGYKGKSLGKGDAFANQIRFVYSGILGKNTL